MNDTKEDRLYDWVMMSVFSAIVLGSTEDTFFNPNSRQKYGDSCAAITMSIGAIVSVLYKLKPDLIGSRIEYVSAFVVLVFWVVNLPFERGDIFVEDFMLSSLFANMYYFSWAALFTSIRLIASLFTAKIEVSEQVEKRLNNWFVLLGLNLVVMITSSYDYKEGMNTSCSHYCRLALLALIIGVFSSWISLTSMFLLSTTFLEKWQPKIECLNAVINTALYAITIGFINGTDGPGGKIGNLYYSMWFSFLMSTMLALECCTGADSAQKEKDVEAAEGEEHKPELLTGLKTGFDQFKTNLKPVKNPFQKGKHKETQLAEAQDENEDKEAQKAESQ